MIIFDPTMFLSNEIDNALNNFSQIYITIPTFETLNKMRNDSNVIIAKKAKKAINLIFENPNKILFSKQLASELAADKENTFYFGDKYSFLYYNRCIFDDNKKAESYFYSPVQNNSFLILPEEEISKICTFYNLKQNDYFIMSTERDDFLYKITNDTNKKAPEYEPVSYQVLDSVEMGKVRPKTIDGKVDLYQLAAIDSLYNNQLTLLSGKAGTGKSYLAMSALFAKLRKHEIDKIYIFCNPVATRDSAKLGFYPGDRSAKLLDSQIGNFLDGKIGDRIGVERLINENKIILLPMSDIRGFDTNGKKAGIYITEAQNTTIDLMQLVLERVGEDCICIIDGDYNHQVDLDIYSDINNGMKKVSQIYRGTKFYGEVCLQNVYRSKIAELAAKMTE